MSTIKTTNIQHPSAASPAVELTAAGGLWLGGGKILQVVRATNATNQLTTSTAYSDANLSVTITPQKSDSELLLIASFTASVEGRGTVPIGYFQITDSSNNAQSGAEEAQIGSSDNNPVNQDHIASPFIIARATPATTSAVTYKLRWKSQGATCNLRLSNATRTAQMFAIEVSA